MPGHKNTLFTTDGRVKPFDRTAPVHVQIDTCTVVAPADPETEPEQITADQRRDVSRAWRLFRGVPDADRVALVSDEVLLDAWTVRRRLRELGHEVPEPERPDRVPVSTRVTVEELVLAALAGGPGTPPELAGRIGRPGDTSWVGRVLRSLAAFGKARVVGHKVRSDKKCLSNPVYAKV